ncbi:MAG: OmpA family protein [Cryomorphaceae bacterium]
MDLRGVRLAPPEINSTTEESFPLLSPDGRLYFVRSIYEENQGGIRAGQDIWYVEPTQNGWRAASNDLGKLNNIFNNGVVGVSDSGNVLFLNSTYSNKLDYQIGLSRSEFRDGGWSTPKRVRMKGFNPKTGFLSFYVDDDVGVMLISFSSSIAVDEDLYVSLKEDGRWQKPIHLGPTINTPGAEFSPYLSDDGRVLYFSSNGHPGLGGADIFMSRRLDDSWQSWSEPVGLQEPINSPAFDAYYTLHDTVAYFASNRNGDFSDIYIATYGARVQEARPELAQEDTASEAPFIIVGRVNDKKLGKLDDIDVLDEQGELVSTVEADEKGEFVLENLPNYQRYYLDLNGKLDDPGITMRTEEGDEVDLLREMDRNRFMFEVGDRRLKQVIEAKVMVASSDQVTRFGIGTGDFFEDKIKMSLRDRAGKEIESMKLSQEGKFDLQKIKKGELYSLEASDIEALEGKALFVEKDSAWVEASKYILQGFPFKKLPSGEIVLYQDELLSTALSTKFAFDYSRLDMAGSTVYLYDEKGDPIQKAVVNENGFFAFEQLEASRKYSMGLESEKDLSDNLPTLYGIDQEGERIALADEILLGKQFQGDPAKKVDLAESREVFYFDESNVPPEGTKVYLTDADDRPIDSSYVDKDGNIFFKRLPSSGAFSIRFANPQSLDLTSDRYFIVDAEGNKIELDATGKSISNIVGAEMAETTETFTFDGENAPPAGTVVYVTDEFDNVIDSATVDEDGEIRFTRLPPDGNFKLKLEKTDDISMGLDRFFIVDASGDRIGFNEKGETTSKVASAAQAETTEIFNVSSEDGDGPPEGTVVYAVDENNNVIDSAVVDEFGEVKFTRLPPDGNFKLKLEKTVDGSMGLDRFFVVDASGDEIEFNEKGETTKKIVGKKLAETTEVFKVSNDDGGGPPEGTVVYAVDENNNVIDSAVVDEFGEVKFTRLPPDGNFKLKLEKTVDGSMGLDRFFIVDASGDEIEFNDKGETTKKIAGKKQAETTEIFTVSGEDGGPPEGTVVYAYDQNDNVIDSAVVDEFGEVKFTRLPADGNFKLKLEKTVDNSMGLDRFFIVDAVGDKVEFNPEGETEKKIVGSVMAKRIDYYKFDYDKLPPKGAMVYLLDEDNVRIDSALVGDENKFRFLKLDPEKKYGLEVQNADGGLFQFDSFTLTSRDGTKIVVEAAVSNTTRFVNMDPKELEERYDQFAFEAKNAPKLGAKVKVYNAAGFLVDSAIVYANGRFNVSRLKRQETYSIRVDQEGYNLVAARLFTWKNGRIRMLPYLKKGFSYRPIEPMKVQDTEINFDMFMLATDDQIDEGAKVYLIESAQNSVADSAAVEPDGSFKFKELDREKEYSMEFNDKVNTENATLYSISDGTQKEVASAEVGFSVAPKELLAPKTMISIASSQPRLSSVQDDAIASKQQAYPSLPEHYAALSEQERDSKYERFQFDPRYMPDAGTEIRITDKRGNAIASTEVYQGGIFFVDKLSGEETYLINVGDEAFSIEGATLYAVQGALKRKLTRLGKEFVYRPRIEDGDTDLVISLSGSGEPDTGEKTSSEEHAGDDFALTPPRDKSGETVNVGEDKVTKTVFEEDKPATEAKPTVARAVLDESDYKLRSGVAQVVETQKGWDMHFDFNRFLLSDFQIDYIYKVVIPLLKKNPDMTLTLEGHTDDVGSDSVNYRVSILRISNVLYHLEMAGIEDTQIRVLAKGETEPIAPNDSEMGRALNRRVEFLKEQEGK